MARFLKLEGWHYAIRTFFLILCLLLTCPQAGLAESFTADIQTRKPGQSARVCGQMAFSKDSLNVSAEIGHAGEFQLIVPGARPEFYLLSGAMHSGIIVPFQGKPHDVPALTRALLTELSPFGIALFDVRIEKEKALGSATWQGYKVQKHVLNVRCLLPHKEIQQKILLWERSLDSLPMRIELITPDDVGGYIVTRNIELTNIRPGKPQTSRFTWPAGYANMGNALEFLLPLFGG